MSIRASIIFPFKASSQCYNESSCLKFINILALLIEYTIVAYIIYGVEIYLPAMIYHDISLYFSTIHFINPDIISNSISRMFAHIVWSINIMVIIFNVYLFYNVTDEALVLILIALVYISLPATFSSITLILYLSTVSSEIPNESVLPRFQYLNHYDNAFGGSVKIAKSIKLKLQTSFLQF